MNSYQKLKFFPIFEIINLEIFIKFITLSNKNPNNFKGTILNNIATGKVPQPIIMQIKFSRVVNYEQTKILENT